MRKIQFLLIVCLLFGGGIAVQGQKTQPLKSQTQSNRVETEREIKEFFDSYGEDLRLHRREALVSRYDSRGCFLMGNGKKSLTSFEDIKKLYLTEWKGPKSFAWKDLSIEVLSPNAAVVVGLFDWHTESGRIVTGSYTGLLVKRSGKWKIRVEDESAQPVKTPAQ